MELKIYLILLIVVCLIFIFIWKRYSATITSQSVSFKSNKTLVAKVVDKLLYPFVALGIIRIKAETLMYLSEKISGKSDYGIEVKDSLTFLCNSLTNEAKLTHFGTCSAFLSITSHLLDNLWETELLKQNQQIQQFPITKPLFIVGLNRSGTTILFNLIAQNKKQFRFITLGESLARNSFFRFLMKIFLYLQNQTQTGMKAVHKITINEPEECLPLLQRSFRGGFFPHIAHVPTYINYLENMQDSDPNFLLQHYSHYKKILQIHQWKVKQVANHWVLKCPDHLAALEELITTFPDACILWTHRELISTIASNCSFHAFSRSMESDHVNMIDVGLEVYHTTSRNLSKAMEFSKKYPGRVLNIFYEDIVKDAVGTVKRIHEHFGYPLEQETEELMKKYMKENPQHKFGKHTYNLEDAGLSKDRILENEIFQQYTNAYFSSPFD